MKVYYAPHVEVTKEWRESHVCELGDPVPENARLRSVLDDEIIIEFDSPIKRTDAWQGCMSLMDLLEAQRIFAQMYDHRGVSPHVHIRIMGLEKLSHEQRKKYRFLFWDKYCPPNIRGFLDESFADSFRWVALENVQHYKGNQNGIDRGIKTLIRETTFHAMNQLEPALLSLASQKITQSESFTATQNVQPSDSLKEAKGKALLKALGKEKLPKGSRNKTLFKNIAVYLQRFKGREEIIRRIASVQQEPMASIQGWVKKVDEGEIKEFNIREIEQWERENNYPLPVEGNPTESGPKTLNIIDGLELYNKPLPPISWLIPNIVPEKGLLVLGGDSGVGKSWFTLALSIALAKGSVFLGKWQLRCSKILVIDEENSLELIKDRLVKCADDSKDLQNIYFASMQNVKFDIYKIGEILPTLKALNPKVVICDSLVRFFAGKNENDARDVSQVFDCIKKMQEVIPDALFIILHHVVKNRKGNGKASLRGSGDIPAMSDCCLMLDKIGIGKIRVDQVKNRKGIEADPFVYEMTEADDGKVRFAYIETSQEDYTEEKRCVDELLNWTESLGVGSQFRNKEAVAAMRNKGFSQSTTTDALKHLVLVGKIVQPRKYGKYQVAGDVSHEDLR